jgi:hypothetical protein
VSPVRAEDNVVLPQMRADAGRDGFLTDVGVTRAVDEPALMATRQLLLRLADELHRAVEGE